MTFNPTPPLSPNAQRYLRIPLKHLTDKTRSVLSTSLNNKKYICAENGCCRDWRGIMELCGLRNGYYDIVDNSTDHMVKMLELWCMQEGDLCPKANVGNLLQFLEDIDRFDVADDIRNIISADLEKFEDFESGNSSENNRKYEKIITTPLPIETNEVLTIQDLERLQDGKPLKNYDAFILFEDEDIEFVSQLLDKLSNYHLCKKSDLVRQAFEHTAVVELIEKRCRRVIAVISDHFLHSSSNSNRFLVDFAQASQVENGDLRIIPVVTEREVEKYIPSNLKYLHKVQFYKNSSLYDFWKILESTLMDKSTICKQQNTPQKQTAQKVLEVPGIKNQIQESHLDPINNNIKHSQSMSEICRVIDELPLPPTNSLINSSMTNLAEPRSSKTKWYKNFFKRNKKGKKVLAE